MTEKPAYILFNLRTKKGFVHPKVGLWHSQDLHEAEDLLRDIREIALEAGGNPEELVVRAIQT